MWGPIAVVALRDPNGNIASDAAGILAAILIGLAVATATVGFLFGATTQLRWVWFAAVLGTWAAQLAGYVTSMLMVPQPGGVEDNAAGAGVVIFSMPVLLAVTGLLWAGSGIGWVARVARRRFLRRTSRR